MRLNLQNEDSEFSRKIAEDLFRIEQYVEMVLCYLRLDANATDYVIKDYSLDAIVKQAVKKFASQFIRRKIRLEYEPLDTWVLTDEKWLLFVRDHHHRAGSPQDSVYSGYRHRHRPGGPSADL